ncbi:MAG: protein-L-isoaspartate(D-aspartate) O-methyltransferase [Pirellulales bacterium]
MQWIAWAGWLGFAAASCLGNGRTCQAQTDREFAAARQVMVEVDIASAGIKDRTILAAMRDTPRHEFVPAAVRRNAYFDMSLPIGEQQTISPPFIVAQMTQQLELKPNDKVLEIGTGSGYQAAILSRLVKEVYTIEILETLGRRAQETFQRLGYRNIKSRIGDGYQGWTEAAPFNKIIVTCSPERVPQPLTDQLAEGGRLVIPVGERYQQILYVMEKRGGKLVVKSREPTFFVPMTGTAESQRERLPNDTLSGLVNGDFEKLLDGNQPAGWFYLRQASVEAAPRDATQTRAIKFVNQVPGRSSQALQAIGVDGRRVSALVVDATVRAQNVRDGQLAHQQAGMLFNFYDAEHRPLPPVTLGPWRGTFDWSRRQETVSVPPEARGAVVALGLLGATGQLSCEEVVIRPVGERTARP